LLVFIDESGFSRVTALTRSWAPAGQTPRQRAIITHKYRLSLLGALTVSPRARRLGLHLRTERGVVDGLVVRAFLKRLLRQHRGPILLVWDSAPIHTRRAVREFAASHPRLEVIVFPKYAPELNPVEYVWAQIKHALAGTAPLDLAELRKLLVAATRRVRSAQWRLRACLKVAPLNWRGTSVK
jgi:putative transposase